MKCIGPNQSLEAGHETPQQRPARAPLELVLHVQFCHNGVTVQNAKGQCLRDDLGKRECGTYININEDIRQPSVIKAYEGGLNAGGRWWRLPLHGPGKVRLFNLGSGKCGWLVVVAAIARAPAWGVGTCGWLVVVAAIARTGLTAHGTGRRYGFLLFAPFFSVRLRVSPFVSARLRLSPCVSICIRL